MRLTVEQLIADIAAIDKDVKWLGANREGYVNEFDAAITVDEVLVNLGRMKAGKEAALARLRRLSGG